MDGINRATVRNLEGLGAITKSPWDVLVGSALRRLPRGYVHWVMSYMNIPSKWYWGGPKQNRNNEIAP